MSKVMCLSIRCRALMGTLRFTRPASIVVILYAGWVKGKSDAPVNSVPCPVGYAALYPSYIMLS